MPRKSQKIGKKIGRLTVLSTTKKFFKDKPYTFYICICDCGKQITTSLIRAKSCGCLQRDNLAERSRKELGWASKRAMWNYYRTNAKARDYSWELEYDQFLKLIQMPCEYCGVEPSDLFETPDGDKCVKSGIDRVNNVIGYHIDNVVPCCKICNRAKGTLDIDTFKKWISRIKNK